MMQSSQVSDALLAEALIYAYYPELFRLAISLLEDIQSARQAVMESLTQAVAGRYSYWGEPGLQEWMYVRVIQAARRQQPLEPAREDWIAGGALSEDDRLALLLRYSLNLDTPSIARLLAENPQETQARLDKAFSRAKESISQAKENVSQAQESISQEDSAANGAYNAPEQSLEARLEGLFDERWPVRAPGAGEMAALCGQIVQAALASRGRRARTAPYKEAALLLGAILLVLLAGWSALRLFPEPAKTPAPSPLALITQPASATTGPQATRLATVETTPTLTPVIHRTYQVVAGDNLLSISGKTGLSVRKLRELNQLLPGVRLQPGDSLILGLIAPAVPPSATPTIQVERPVALTISSSLEQVRQRMGSSNLYWHTAWVEGMSVAYGPARYVGPPEVLRTQAWIDNRALYALDLWGSLDDAPGNVRLIYREDAWIYGIDRVSGELVTTAAWTSGLSTNISIFFNPDDWLSMTEEMHIAGVDTKAGRDVLVLSTGDMGGEAEMRLWIDALTGTILRWEYSVEHDILMEAYVTRVVYGVDVPLVTALESSPLPAAFSQDWTGEPEEAQAAVQPVAGRPGMPRLTAPQGFDPAAQPLEFQWIQVEGINGAEQNRAEVFAGGYFLGTIDFTWPYLLDCARSPDGRLVAFLDAPTMGGVFRLAWFNLGDLEQVHRPQMDVPMGDNLLSPELVFSPDGSQLALYRCAADLDGCGVFLLDMSLDEFTRLLRVSEARSLAWSPDGAYLAMLGEIGRDPDVQVLVVNARTGEVVYSQPFENETVLAGSPTHEWGIEFPVMEIRVDGCRGE